MSKNKAGFLCVAFDQNYYKMRPGIACQSTYDTSRASDFFKIGGPKWPMVQKMVGHFLK